MNITSYLTKGLFHAQTIFITSNRIIAAIGASLDIVDRSKEKTRCSGNILFIKA
jgi:hypothetical protein